MIIGAMGLTIHVGGSVRSFFSARSDWHGQAPLTTEGLEAQWKWTYRGTYG